jgi:hypothetical protein
MDPFIRKVNSMLLPTECILAYADDMAVIIDDWERPCGPSQAPAYLAIPRLFHFFGRISNLKVSPTKTLIIPLTSGTSLQNMVESFERPSHPWRSAPFLPYGKYLGFQIGPFVSLETQWAEPVKKYTERCLAWSSRRNMGQQWLQLAYNIFCLPVLAFRAQILHMPEAIHKQLDFATAKFMGGPFRWFPGSLSL